MQRLRGIIFNALAALSLVLCVAMVVLWVRSYWVRSYIESLTYWTADGRGHSNAFYGLSCRGELLWMRSRIWTEEAWALPAFHYLHHGQRNEGTATRKWSSVIGANVPETFAGFGYRHSESSKAGDLKMTGTSWALAVPYWGMSAFFSFLPVLWWMTFRRAQLRRRRLHDGACIRCGYDLRATPDRCPECGTIVKTKPRDAADKPAG